MYYTHARTAVRKAFADALLGFFDREKRDLPWRRRPSAYYTLVSELMLQQTVVATVIPYFHRFTARFPDLATLAAAEEGEVLAHWSGLGYYARGRNLHRAARAVVDAHGGELPADEAALLELPGVGPYTAAAIAAIAFGIRTFPLDGNGARVFARVFDERGAIDLPKVREGLRSRALALVPEARPGDFAQAVMDLGATVCTPTSPECGRCPVSRHCAGFRAGRAAELPVRTERKAKRVLEWVGVVGTDRERLLVVARPDKGLLAGTFAPIIGDGSEPADALAAVTAAGLEIVGEPKRQGTYRHVFTHLDVTVTVFAAKVRGKLPVGATWISAGEAPNVALATFTRKALALVGYEGPRRAPQRKARMASPATT